MPALLIAVVAAAAGMVASAPAAPRAAVEGRSERPADDELILAQLTFHSRITVRIQSAPAAEPPPYVELREKKGPHCVPMAGIQGAAVIAGNSVDFILRGGHRVRAKFDANCPALDYYSGFYLTPGADGQVCAGRDAVRSRAGGECAIDRFRSLVPKRRR
jgi:hypothetical protein